MVDKSLILRKFAKLDECLKQIGEFSAITLNEYSKDWKTQRIVERTSQIMIETCVDIISDRGYRMPDNYGDTFQILYENGIIEKDAILEIFR